MGALLFLVNVIALLAYWELKIKLLMVFRARSAYAYIDKYVTNMARQLFASATVYGGLRLEIDNTAQEVLPDRFLVISNHQSLADIPFLMVMLRKHVLRFVAKKNLGRGYPAVSAVLRFRRHALIERDGSFSQTYRQMRRMALQARSGIIPVVFPEGTRSKTGRVGPFHEGAVRTVLQLTRLPVVIVAVEGGYRFSRLRQTVQHMRGSTYRGRILSVHPAPTSKKQIAAIVERAREEIVGQINSWRERDKDVASPVRLESTHAREDGGA